MHCPGVLAAGHSDVQSVTQQMARRVVGEIRAGKNVPKPGGVKTVNPRIVLDVVRVVQGQKPQSKGSRIQRKTEAEQRQHDRAMNKPNTRSPVCATHRNDGWTSPRRRAL